jgi:putative ABC transport system permease protein
VLFALAWRNLWRQKMRTILSLLSMALASTLLVFMLSFQLGVYDTMKGNALRIFDGFAQIQPDGYQDDPDIKKVLVIPGISAATQRATGFVILANGDQSYGGAVVGIDPKTEPKVSSLGAAVHDGRYLQPGDSDAVVMGSILARNLGLKLGDRVTLIGSGLDGSVAADSLQLVGLFHTGMADLDRQIAEMPLDRFKETFAMGPSANVIALAGPSLDGVDAALPQLAALAARNNLTVADWRKLEPAIDQGITLDFSSAMLFYVSLVVVVVFIILNTLLMSVLERTREFGMLLAIGMRPGRIGVMVWYELILLAVLGNAIGIALGGALALYFQFQGISFAGMEAMMAQYGLSDRLYPALSATSALAGPLVIVVSVMIAGLVPYRRIGALQPVAAMGAV